MEYTFWFARPEDTKRHMSFKNEFEIHMEDDQRAIKIAKQLVLGKNKGLARNKKYVLQAVYKTVQEVVYRRVS